MLNKDIRKYLPGRLRRRLEGGPARPPISYRVQIPSDAKDLLVGFRLQNRYYVLSVLGMGGMSVVYKAKDLQERGKIVAIKTLRVQTGTDERVVKRFAREAEALALLSHRNIVRIYDYGRTKMRQHYFVMDYITGTSLNDVIQDERQLAPKRVIEIFDQVCSAVDHAHKQGIIHRDLKPGNIMLIPRKGRRELVKVVDFGIAKFEEEEAKLTRMGEVWGSPIYMSPEQCMGSNLDARSDVYSLGVVMYEALTGQVPFLGKKYIDTMTMQINDPPKRFSEMRPDLKIPAKIEEAVFKCLCKEPDRRYQTAGELRKDLEACISDPRRSGAGYAAQSRSSGRQSSSGNATVSRERYRNPADERKNSLALYMVLVVVAIVVVSLGVRLFQGFH